MSSQVIAIDGTAYSGKSHIARGIAKITGFEYINTGHMFRALAHMAKKKSVDLGSEVALLAMPFHVCFVAGSTIVSDKTSDLGEDWTQELESPEIVQDASRIAVYPAIRQKLAEMQRSYAKEKFIIMEGRDIGSVVFPDALCRVYVTAEPLVRAKRLYKTLPSQKKNAQPPTTEFINQLLNEKLTPIDQLDANRKFSPLISEESAEKLGYYIHKSPEHYSVEDDVRDIYKNYIKEKLDGIHC